MPATHQAAPLTWCVVKPNAPVAGRAAAPAQTPLRFLAAATRPQAAGAAAPEAPELPGTLFQAAGPVLIEVPLSDALSGPPALVGFVAGRR